MKFSVLGSGSKGNCTLVESGSTRLLIDNGFSGKEIIARLAGIGIAPETLTALVVTHEHDDHIKGIGVLARRLNVPVYANNATHRASEHRVGSIPVQREFGAGEPFYIEALQIHPFSVSHDSADPVGFVISDEQGSLGYCTDTGKITRLIHHHLRRCRALILEANHDIDLLKQGPYPLPLKQRVLSGKGHLANIDALGLAAELAADRLELVVLAHLSEINNHPDLVLKEVKKSLSACHHLRVLLADQSVVGPLLEVP